MKAWTLVSLIACSAAAFATETLVNPGFEKDLTGWRFNRLEGYDGEITPDAREGVKAFRIWSRPGEQGTFAPVLQAIDAHPFRGKIVRFRAWVRYEPGDRDGAAQLWMRVDRPEKKIGFFMNMDDRPVTGSEWSVHEISGPVSADAEKVYVGGFLRGGGSMWIDDASFDVLDSESVASDPISGEAATYLESAISLIEKESIRRASVDWEAVRKSAQVMAAGATAPNETYHAIRWVLSELGDRHSFFKEPSGAREWAQAGASDPIPEPELRQPGIAQIAVPPFGGGDPGAVQRYAGEVQRRIAAIDKEAHCGWIVDLRQNSGGNMWPMLSGLGPLLGEGEILELETVDDRIVVEYRDGRARYRGRPSPPAPDFVYRPERARPVAVLTSSRTASSGEAVAIAFRGHPRARSFGTATAGLSTGNRAIRLSDGALIFLTSSIMGDRHGRMYGGAIHPDVETATEEDTFAAAVAWLRSVSGCDH